MSAIPRLSDYNEILSIFMIYRNYKQCYLEEPVYQPHEYLGTGYA